MKLFIGVCVGYACLAVVTALPAGKPEDRSIAEKVSATAKDLPIDEITDDKDRSKKAASFCVEIRPGDEEGQDSQDAAQSQTVSVVQPSQMQMPQVQTYSFQQAAQPLQALSVAQVPQQSFVVPQQSFVMPQQVMSQQLVPSVQTLQIIQPQQPYTQQSRVEIVQTKCGKSEPEPATTTPEPETVTTPKPAPERIVAPETEVVETVKIVPVQPACNEKVVVVPPKPMVVVPEPTVVKIPHCHHHHQHQHNAQGLQLAPCNCKQQFAGMRSAVMGPIEPVGLMGMRTHHSHYAPYGKIITDYHMKVKA